MIKTTSAIKGAFYPLSIFQHRNYLLVWCSSTLVNTGTQMESLVLAWFVLTLTDSPFLVGLIAAARMALNFLALFAGAFVDRLPRSRLLATVEFFMATLGLVMLTLVLTGLLEIWHVFALTLCTGLVRLFQMPTAQSLVADSLPQERIGNGAAFTTLGQHIATLIGPLIGGLLFKSFGALGAYFAITALYLISGLAALTIRVDGSSTFLHREPVLRTVMEGLKYVRGNQVLWATLVVAVIINLAGWTFHTSLVPIFAGQVLNTDSAGLGVLLFAFGIGALGGSTGLSMVRNLRRVGLLMISAVIAWHGTILVFTVSSSFSTALVILVFTGMAFGSTQVFILTALLRTAQAEFRGRVMGLRSMAIFGFTIGSMTSGGMAGLWGAPTAAMVVGLSGIAMVALLALAAPSLRRL